jgi:hypothetical protein
LPEENFFDRAIRCIQADVHYQERQYTSHLDLHDRAQQALASAPGSPDRAQRASRLKQNTQDIQSNIDSLKHRIQLLQRQKSQSI